MIARYITDGATVEELPTITLSSLSCVEDGDVHKVRGVATRSVPDGYTLIEHGMLYARDVAGLTEDTFVYGTTGVERKIATKTETHGTYALNVKVENDDVVVSLRGFMRLTNNATGNEEVYYTECASASYNDIKQ